MDFERTGVTGYSYGDDIALALSGVRIDPQAYLEHCAAPPQIDAGRGVQYYLDMTCSLAKKWAEFTAYTGESITTSDDELWQPVTDKRIRAVLPMARSGAWLYGARGLATANRPILIIAMTDDEFSPYAIETAFIFEHPGVPERSIFSFIGKTHLSIMDSDVADRMKHFVVAFFGYHLQGKEEYLDYFSPVFVAQFDDLAWRIY